MPVTMPSAMAVLAPTSCLLDQLVFEPSITDCDGDVVNERVDKAGRHLTRWMRGNRGVLAKKNSAPKFFRPPKFFSRQARAHQMPIHHSLVGTPWDNNEDFQSWVSDTGIVNDDVDEFKKMFETGRIDLNKVYYFRHIWTRVTVLPMAAEFAATKCAKFILAHGGDPYYRVDHDEYEQTRFYARYNPMQIAIIAHGRDSPIAQTMRFKQFLRRGFDAFCPEQRRALTVLLCAQRSDCALSLLPQHVLHLVLRRAFR